MSVSIAGGAEYIRILNCLDPADSQGNHTPANQEYFRGQVELLANLVGYDDDPESTIASIHKALGVHQDP